MSPERLAEAEACYAAVVKALRGMPGVMLQTKKGFGSGGLMTGDKLFATLRKDELLLKLPALRVAALVGAGHGSPFDAGKGRPMKEWVTVKLEAGESWADLARDAMWFVARSNAA